MKKAKGKSLIWILMVTLIAALSCSIAWADFYVLGGGSKAKKTIRVSPKGTDTESGTALLNAINGITDASASNPYLIIIEPGIYDIGDNSLQMKEYVDIQGAGEEATKITGTIGIGSSGVLKGADNAEVRFLTVENTGSAYYATGIYNSSVSPAITNVTAIASGGTGKNYGVWNYFSSPKMTNVTATASGGTNSYGIHNESSSPKMTNVTATASGGTNNYGINNQSSSPKMTNVTATGSGGSSNYGVYNVSSSCPTMINVTATASGGTSNSGVANYSSSYPTITNVTAIASGGSFSNYGVYNGNPSGVTIHHSVLSGDVALQNESSGVTTYIYIGNTRLDGGVSGNTVQIKCAGVYDEEFTFYEDTCP